MSEKKKTCKGCKYVLADTTYRKGNGYYCINQNSENFGRDVKELSGCADYDQFDAMPDIPFKDALDQLVMGPKGAYPSWFPLFGREGELHRPFLCITFVDNKQMLEYRDASLRCFDELMKLKKEAGDFVDPEPEEKG